MATQIGRTHQLHEKLLSSTQERLILLSPFIKKESLERLLSKVGPNVLIQVVARWRLSDLVMGVSDLEVYRYLKGKNIPLYINHSIHLKVLLSDQDKVIIGSSNITDSGLGYRPDSNIEASTQVPFIWEIEQSVLEIIRNSVLVTDDLFDQISQKVEMFKDIASIHEEQTQKIKKEEQLIDFHSTDTLLFNDFPFSESPEYILNAVKGGAFEFEILHDLAILGITPETSVSEELLLSRFKGTHAYQWQEKTLLQETLFGKYSELLHNALQDDPTPYRKDVKRLVGNMFNWSGATNEWDVVKFNHSSSLVRK